MAQLCSSGKLWCPANLMRLLRKCGQIAASWKEGLKPQTNCSTTENCLKLIILWKGHKNLKQSSKVTSKKGGKFFQVFEAFLEHLNFFDKVWLTYFEMPHSQLCNSRALLNHNFHATLILVFTLHTCTRSKETTKEEMRESSSTTSTKDCVITLEPIKDLDLLSTSKSPSEPQLFEKWRHSWRKNGINGQKTAIRTYGLGRLLLVGDPLVSSVVVSLTQSNWSINPRNILENGQAV